MRSALITGITGQDGGYLTEQLVGRGIDVHGLVRPGEPVPGHLSALGPAVELHEASLDDEDQLRAVVNGTSPDAVFNLVGLSSVALSWAEPVQAAQVNGVLVARLLQLLWERQERTGSIVRFVQASSAEIFAGAVSTPQNEHTPIMPRSPYGASKAFAHGLVQVYRARGLHASNAVLYNHESPRRPATFVTRKITSTVAAIAAGQADELVLGNLDARRDWGWAPEYVDAMVRMADAAQADDYVIGTGRSYSVRDFVNAAFASVGVVDWLRYVRVDPSFIRPADAIDLVADSSRAREQLQWSASVGLEQLVAWMVAAERSMDS